jgi:hypothetical protein
VRRERLEHPSRPLLDPVPTVSVDALALNGFAGGYATALPESARTCRAIA